MRLADLLEIQSGVTAVIGSGGKTTLLRTLGSELSERGRVLLCTTTKIYPFPQMPCAQTAEELCKLRREHRLLCAGSPAGDTGKLTAPAVSMARLKLWFDYVLVEADGSAGRPMKAHAPHEPVIPGEADQTVLVVGASGFGRPIAAAAHRPERYAALADEPAEALITPQTEAAVLLGEALHDRVFVNQAETPERLCLARQLAALLKGPVLAGTLRGEEYWKCL
jgi:probable selenium-dependent hydroxylase accessory protein YqeC